MLVLGIETSCDETGLAIYDSEKGLLADELHSQIAIHQDYGGVVPELASRDHADRVLPLLRKLLKTTKKSPDDIDLVAYTAGPGLKGCLLVGSTFARTLAHAIDKPIISVNHIEAHLLAPFMEYEDLTFPFFGLLISGGHTMIVDAKNIGEYEIMGETLDDAVGEAFDKSAKLMGLDYPGGPLIEKLAKEGKISNYKTVKAVDLWRKILSMLFETGHPWITFKDPCNLRSPQQHVGVVHSSNLCTEITLNTSKDEIAVCNLGSVNLAAHIDKNNKLNTKKLQKTISTAMRMLDNVCLLYTSDAADE